MSTSTKIGLDEFLKLPEADTTQYELDEGELLVTPSPTARHNEICYRIHRALWDFSLADQLGYVTGETDFLLSPDTVRRPDAAFITPAQLQRIDLDRSPLEGAPALAIEVISPGNDAQDILKKTHQYLDAGSELVWIVYPALKVVSVYSHTGTYEVSQGFLQAENLLPGFQLSLAEIFEQYLRK
ncbi:MAG TPA: Uma2 family endonuclease [Candidatus Angelobacter sp.]|jgi:Uma2 family endonuclease|nr:Uma2 family endonuclease [Candidatus Angelobacter sp.]